MIEDDDEINLMLDKFFAQLIAKISKKKSSARLKACQRLIRWKPKQHLQLPDYGRS